MVNHNKQTISNPSLNTSRLLRFYANTTTFNQTRCRTNKSTPSQSPRRS